MAAISYGIALNQLLNGSVIQGSGLEAVVPSTNAPTAGFVVEIRMDQTTSTVTDGSLPLGTRAPKKSEIQYLIRVLEEYLMRDTNVVE